MAIVSGRRWLRAWALVLWSALLAACGGGPPPVPRDATVAETRDAATEASTPGRSPPGDGGTQTDEHAHQCKREETTLLQRALTRFEDRGGTEHQLPPGTIVMIATVPDPRDDRLRYLHDGDREALLLAIEREGFHRTWTSLPWASPSVRTGNLRVAIGATSECQWESPASPPVTGTPSAIPEHAGLVVFRQSTRDPTEDRGTGPDPHSTPLVILLLVPERPDAGPDQDALHEALCAVQSDALPPDGAGGRRVLIGPTFSGSSVALRGELDTRGTRVGYLVVNGSATGDSVREFDRPAGSPSIILRSTTTPDHELEQRFYEYLQDELGVERNGWLLEHVAMLQESGTGYGAEALLHGVLPGRESRSIVPELQLTFPLHVAATVREAYRQQDRLHREGREHREEPGEPPGRTRSLDPTFTDPTAVSLDVGIDRMLAEVSHKGIRYLGIKATDPADIVFLARKVRDVAPDIRLFLLVSDQYFLSSEFLQDMLGSFVVTPYPFLGVDSLARELHASDAGAVEHPGQSHTSFASSTAQGIYNAAAFGLAILRGRDNPEHHLVEYTPFRHAHGLSTSSHFSVPAGASPARAQPEWLAEHSAPAVWISVVGATGLAPVAVLPGNGGPGYPGRPKGTLLGGSTPAVVSFDPDVTPPRFSQFLLAVLSLLGLALVYHVWRIRTALVTLQDATGRWRSLSLFLAAELLVGGGILGSLGLLQVRAFDAYHLGTMDKLGLALVFMLACLALLMLLYFAAWHVRARCFGATPEPSPEPWRDRVFTAGVAIVLLAVLALPVGLHSWIPHAHTGISPERLFALRALPVLNGVTPMVPWVLFLGAIMWGASARRMRIYDLLVDWKLSPECLGSPAREPAPPGFISWLQYGAWSPGTRNNQRAFSAALDEHLPEEDVLHLVNERHVSSVLRYVPLGLVVWGIPVVTLMTFPLHTIEVRVLHWALWGALLLTAGFGSAMVSRLVEYWLALEPLLGRLGTHPIGAAFKRVAPTLAVRVAQQLARHRDDLAWMDACVGVFRDAVRAMAGDQRAGVQGFHAEAQAQLKGLEDHIIKARKLKAKAAEGEDTPSSDVATAFGAELSPELIKASQWSVRLLRAHHWRPAGGAEPLKKAAPLLEAFVASVLAVLIRRQVRPVRWFFAGAVGMAVLMLFALSSYPFQPRQLTLFFSWLTVAVVSGTTLWVYVRMDRNTVLSRIGHTTPGRTSIDFDFLTRVFTLVVIPVATLIAAQFPQVTRTFYDLLAPFARVLR